MNILLVAGSPRSNGNTIRLANRFKNQAEKLGHKCDTFNLIGKDVKPCIHCMKCYDTGKCALKDDLTTVLNGFNNYDCLIIASPIYFFNITSQAKTFLDRLYSVNLSRIKIGAILVSGSEFLDGGAYLAAEAFRKTCEYCSSQFIGIVHKTTYDCISPITKGDNINIAKLISSLEGKKIATKSCFIRG